MATPEDTSSPLDNLRKRLYSAQGIPATEESSFSTMQQKSAEHWKESPAAAPVKPKISGAALFLGAALGFFVIAGATTAGVLYFGGRSVSSENVAISFSENPTSVAGGESVPILITITNKNPIAITGASLTLQFPEGTTEAEDTSVPLSSVTESIGDIEAGGTVRRTVRAAFFGSENQKITVPVTVEYRTTNSNAVFLTKKAYEFTISTSPVGLSITALSEVSSGQPITLSVLARSNSSASLRNVAVRANLPRGFSITSSEPEAVPGTPLFLLGTLAPGEERTIRITGSIVAQEGEERVFSFTAGSLRSETSKEFGALYTENETLVTIAKPFFAVALTLNREDTETVVAKAGQPVVGLVGWSNALSSTIQDGAISISLSGDALDTNNIDTTNGFYRSSDKTIRYDRDTAASLASLKPGDTGNGSFTIQSKTGSAMNALRNPSITLAVSVAGRRVDEANVSDTLSTTITRVIKIQSALSVAVAAVHSSGSFINTGAMPPKVDTETTYTIALSAGNTVNTVANTVAKMTLPSYVRFTGQVSPGSGVTYNESTREVTWALGDMAPAAGKQAAFQIALLPSLSQKGTSPVLVSEVQITGFDRFTKTEVNASASSINIQTISDPTYQDSFGIVAP